MCESFREVGGKLALGSLLKRNRCLVVQKAFRRSQKIRNQFCFHYFRCWNSDLNEAEIAQTRPVSFGLICFTESSKPTKRLMLDVLKLVVHFRQAVCRSWLYCEEGLIRLSQGSVRVREGFRCPNMPVNRSSGASRGLSAGEKLRVQPQRH